MNVERLHAIANAIVADFSETQVLTILHRLVQATSNLAQQPNQQQFQNQVSQGRADLIKALALSKFNEFSPSWRQVITEIGGEIFFDNSFGHEINDLFSLNQMTPSVLASSLQKAHADADGWLEAIHSLATSLDRLNIGSENLPPGECELGVIIPRSFVNDQLDRFSSELSQLNGMFGVFAEIMTGSRSAFKISTISSSDLTVYLKAAPEVGACIATAISKIVELYKNFLEIRKLKSDLSAQGVPDESLKGVSAHAETMMAAGLEKIANETLAESSVELEPNRKNEVVIQLNITLKRLAARIDRGFNIEVRMDSPNDSQEDGITPDANTESSYEAIKQAGKNMQFIKLTGDPILSLPNGDSNINETERSRT